MQMLCKNPELEGQEERAGKTFTLSTDNEACFGLVFFGVFLPHIDFLK